MVKYSTILGLARIRRKTTHWIRTITFSRPGKAKRENLDSRVELSPIGENIGAKWHVDKFGYCSHIAAVTKNMNLSPLDAKHRELGGRMVGFAGWEMPVMYESIMTEHAAVRDDCGVFDISHMGQVFVSGAKAEVWLNGLLTGDVAGLGDGEAHYTFMLNEQGGVIDDLILYRLQEGSYLLVINAACIDVDVAWLEGRLEDGVEMVNVSDDWAGLAVQGQRSPEVYSAITDGRTLPSRNGVDDIQHEGNRLLICRTGYTGEDGFELFCPVGEVEGWWEKLMDEKVVPCGLGARDSLRLEMCYPLNGSDLTTERTPLEAGLGFFVALDKGDFVGGSVLRKQKEEGVKERLMAIQLQAKGAPPRPGYPVLDAEGHPLSVLTSGGLSPSLGEGIGLAYLPVDRVKVGSSVYIEVRGRKIAAKVVKKPFYRK